MPAKKEVPMIAILQKQRRVVIPQQVTEHLGVDEGEHLLFELQTASAVVCKAAKKEVPMTAILQKQRRVVIPQQVTEHLGVDEGDYLLFKTQGNRAVISKAVITAAEV